VVRQQLTSASNPARPTTTKKIETRTMETQTEPIVEDISEAETIQPTEEKHTREISTHTEEIVLSFTQTTTTSQTNT